MSEYAQWDSRISFLFAMIGVAVGLGNIWRFSYVVYSNGGGTFFIPYLTVIALMGIPFLILEYGIGFSFKTSFTEIMKRINPKFEYISWILVAFAFFVVVYYMVILGWDIVYLASSFTFSWGTDASAFFASYVGGSSDLSNFSSFLIPTAIGIVAVWFFFWFISSRDVDEGIGKASKILIPLLFIIMFLIIFHALLLNGSMVGIQALLHPNWNMLWDVNVWLAAFSQIIFSLSVGQAIAITYASYLPRNSKLVDNVLFVVASNSIFETCTAFGVFSILGFMSVKSGMPIESLVSEGVSLIFIVFPTIFNVMGLLGRVLAPLLFLAMLFAGITSALGIAEPVVSSAQSKLGWSRRKTTTVLSVIGCGLSLIFASGISCYLVEIVDGFINQFGILLLIPIQAIIFGWVYGIENVLSVLNENSSIKVGRIWVFIIKYLCPIAVFAVWAFGIYGLFAQANLFELCIDGIIMASVLIISFVFTNRKTVGD